MGMTIREYFKDYKPNKYNYNSLQEKIVYKKTIGDFYNDFIKPHLEKIFIDKKDNLIKWCNVLEEYSNKDLPIYWIRKFESGSGKENVNDNRRNGTTILANDKKEAIAAYAYISNFDAQELYNMILHVDDPTEFEKLMLSGDYRLHYDNGKGSCESKIKSFECLVHARSMGVFNRASLYLAHINDVNGNYESVATHKFESGDVKDWKEISNYSDYNLSGVFAKDPTKKVRVNEYKEDVSSLKKFLKAHFFRFVHPFNYYLVPNTSCEINAIIGRTKKSVGEYNNLTNYVKYMAYKHFIKVDKELKERYEAFEEAILIPDNEKMSKNFDESRLQKLKDAEINIIYGYSMGDESKAIQKLRDKIENVDDLFEIYQVYDKESYKIALKDKDGKEIRKPYGPDNTEYVKFLDKLYSTINKIKTVNKIKVELIDKSSVEKASRKSTKKTGGSKKRSTSDEAYKLIAYYLRNNDGLQKAEEEILHKNSNGSIAKVWLNKHGVDTSSGSAHKGLLTRSSIDDEISKASGIFKETLEEIKKRGL